MPTYGHRVRAHVEAARTATHTNAAASSAVAIRIM